MLTTASVHLDVSIPNFVVQEYSLVDEAESSAIFEGTLRRQGGYLDIPERPGLGIRLDERRLTEIERASMLREPPLRRDGSVAYSV